MESNHERNVFFFSVSVRQSASRETIPFYLFLFFSTSLSLFSRFKLEKHDAACRTSPFFTLINYVLLLSVFAFRNEIRKSFDFPYFFTLPVSLYFSFSLSFCILYISICFYLSVSLSFSLYFYSLLSFSFFWTPVIPTARKPYFLFLLT